ncbi:MAG: motility associated factor glycosyltransferase family protein [Lachnospirales bacterium]
MNNIVEKNLKFIKDLGITLEKKDESPKVYYKKDTKDVVLSVLKVNGLERHMYSTVDVFDGVKKQVEKLDVKSGNVLVIFGAGLFYEVFEIIKKWREVGSVLVIEPDPEIFYQNILRTNLDFQTEIAKFDFLVDYDITYDKVMEFIVKNITHANFLPTIFHSNLAYIDLYKNLYFEALKACRTFVSNMTMTYNTLSYFNINSTEGMGKCIPTFYEKGYSINDLKNICEGKPAIIVSTGPSLVKNVKLLQEVQDKAVIIAAYVALKVLEPLGIKPHFVVSLDGKQVLEKNHKEGDFCENLILSTTGNIDFVDYNKGKTFFYSHAAYPHFLRYIKSQNAEVDYLATGGSVANNAASFAKYIGCNRVILLGQDLAFEGEKSHAYADGLDQIKTNRKKVKGFFGEDVESYDVYLKYRDWFKEYAKVFSDSIDMINATEGGCYIEGFNHITFREVIDKYLVDDIGLSFNEHINIKPTREDIENTIKTMKNECEIYQKTLVKLREVIKHIDKLKKMFEKGDPDLSNLSNDLKKLDKFDKFYEKNGEEYNFIKLIQYVSFMEENNGYPLDYSEDRIIAEKNYKYYHKLLFAIEKGIDILNESIEKLVKIKEDKYGL